MARFMADRPQPSGAAHRYDREGLYRWAKQRFPGVADALSEEEFRTQSRARLHEMMLDVSRKFFPPVGEESIDAKLEEVFEGAELSEPDDAADLVAWMKSTWGIDIETNSLSGVTREAARQVLWNAYDDRFRPEMHRMERGLVLGILDASWKNHLYTMDHLRSGIGLVSYAQVDPKTEYKRQGMKEFDAMWEGVQNKVTDTVFRMEEEEGFNEALWEIGSTIHESAPRLQASQANGQMSTNAGGEGKKPEPIRNRGERVGRNDPCPCGSGKKYKNCHMRQGAA
jgi:preprotein translocase subunit SecA